MIVNEADCMSPNAAYVWLDVLESLPLMTVVIFTTNNGEKLPARLRDRCERFMFQSGGLLMRGPAQELVNRVWFAETGRTDAPDIDELGKVADDKGDVSLRRVLQLLTPHVRTAADPVKSSRPTPPNVAPTAPVAGSSAATVVKLREIRERFNCPAEKFALLAQCGVSTLYAIERGKREPAPSLARRIQEAIVIVEREGIAA